MTDQDIPIRKLYIDSRQRTSGSSHDFTVEIPQQLNFGKNVVACVQDFCCPHSSWTLQQGVNDQLYWFERYMIMPNLPIQTAFHSTTIPQGVCDANSLATAIATAMTADTSQAPMFWLKVSAP